MSQIENKKENNNNNNNNPGGWNSPSIAFDLSIYDITYKITFNNKEYKICVPRFEDDDLELFKLCKTYLTTHLPMDLAAIMSMAKHQATFKSHRKLLRLIHLISAAALQYEESLPKKNVMNLTAICMGAHGAIRAYPNSQTYKTTFTKWENKLDQYSNLFKTAFQNNIGEISTNNPFSPEKLNQIMSK